ncbi:hypothetical protein NMG60_11024868 [Bertholletia excelsa]
MRLWRRAAGALKDQNSVLLARLGRRTALRHPDIEVAVIKATSHNDSHIDYTNSQRVFSWIRMSPGAYLRPFTWALSRRLDKTRSWVVALKGLILMHGVFCCKVSSVFSIGRLPFDLSTFRDAHAAPSKMWPYNALVRSYFSFLDQKSAFLCQEYSQMQNKGKGSYEQYPLSLELIKLHKMQQLLDLLLQIKPQAHGMDGVLILEAMDCVIIEIYDIYSKICNGIAKILVRIPSADKVEASMALKILKKASVQGEHLSSYFLYCSDMGALSASECPSVQQVPEEDIQELERVINGVSTSKQLSEDKSIVVRDEIRLEAENYDDDGRRDSKDGLQPPAIISVNWEVFDEDLIKIDDEEYISYSESLGKMSSRGNPFESPYVPLIAQSCGTTRPQDVPDLITFSDTLELATWDLHPAMTTAH